MNSVDIKIKEKQTKEEHIPYFIKIRGCVNCDASKELKRRTGKEYGFDHEVMVRCLLYGCDGYDINLTHPFLDPVEVVRLAKKELEKRDINEAKIIKKTREYCMHVKKVFGKFYEKIGISLDDIIKQIDLN